MKDPVVVAVADDVSSGLAPNLRSAWKILFVLGLALASVGTVDLGVLIFPTRLDSLDWEFATISGVFDGLALTTLGLGMMLASSIARGWMAGRRVMVLLMLVLALLIGLALLVFLLDVPAALRAVQPALQPTIRKAALKTSLIGVVYFAMYTTLGIWAWRLKVVGKGVVR